MKVAVIGAGKMGLPLACQFAAQGAFVYACDLRQSLVDAINNAECPIHEPGVPELLERAVKAGRLKGTTDTASAVADSDVVVVIVPALLTPDNDADLSALVSVSEQIARVMRPGTMVSYETTVPIGSTRRVMQPVLEQSGLKAGVDFDLVYSPERVKSLLVLKHLTQTPKVVGGINAKAATRGADFYGKYLGAPVTNVGSLEAAEMVKVAGMIYRDVNIALANEMARYAEAVGVDFGKVIESANTDGEAYILQPGIGVGGHCTPVYPYFMIRDAERRGIPVTLAERSRQVNDTQASHMLDRVEREWGTLKGKQVMILGLAFRPSVKEYILSPAFIIQEELQKRGATVVLHDPMYSDDEIRHHGFAPASLEQAQAPAVVILATSHPEYETLDFDGLRTRGTAVVVDGRNLWDAAKIRQSGLSYFGVGRASAAQAPAKTSIQVARPVMGAEEALAAANVIRSGWIVQGPQVAQFEKEFANFVGAQHACAVSSGTTALHLALLVAGIQPDDEVITVSHSFIATANVIRYCGATPVFVDIEPGTFNMDPALVEAAITPKTRAILCVHQMGMPCDLSAIVKLARARGLLVIEDAACAIGSEILWNNRWEKIGAPHGDIACFSFHPRKVMSTGDGGMITTSNKEWDAKFRLLRQHGMSVPDTVRHGSSKVIFESYPIVGYNYRMTDIQAAVGREQLKRLPEIFAGRRRIGARYFELLRDIPGVELPLEPEYARSNWQSFCVRLPAKRDQRDVMQLCLDAGISTRRGIMCSHREEPYLNARRGGSLAHSEAAQDHCIVLPLYIQMTDDDVRKVVDSLRVAVGA